MAIQIAPFQVSATVTQKGFTLDFRGLRGSQVIDVRMTFPMWWVEHLTARIAPVRRRAKAG